MLHGVLRLTWAADAETTGTAMEPGSMHAGCIVLRDLHKQRSCTSLAVRAANNDRASRTPEGFHRCQAAAAGSRQYSWLCGALAAPPKATSPCWPQAVSDRPEP